MGARSRVLAALGAGLLLTAAGTALAQGLADDPEGSGAGGPPAWAYSMAHDLMSPFCPGRTLAACPSPQADQLRQWILFQAAAGQSREQIEETLFARFGDVLRSSPRAEGGWGISAYAIPIGGFLLGGPLVAFAIYRLARGRSGSPSAPAAPADGLEVPATARFGAGVDAEEGAPRGRPLSDDELERMVREEFARSA